MQKKLSFCFLRQNLSAFVETETYRNRKFDPETEISASGSTFGFVSAQPLDMTPGENIAGKGGPALKETN